MYIRLEQLAIELGKRLSVQTFNVSDQIVTDIRMFPLDFDQSTQRLPGDVCYVCDYRKLRFLDPHIRLAPLICVVEPGAMVHGVFFSNRIAITVTGTTVSELMVMLTRIAYEFGGRSSPVTESAHELMNCRGIQEKLDLGFRLLGNPLVLTDRHHWIIAHADNGSILDPPYDKALAEGYLPVGHPGAKAVDMGEREREHPYLSQIEGDAAPVMVKTLMYRGRIMGHLQMLRFSRPFAEEDGPILDMLGSLLSIDLYERPQTKTGDEHLRQKEAFLQDIMYNARDPEYIRQGAERLRLALGDNLYVIIVNVRETGSPVFRSYYETSKQMAQTLGSCFGFLFRNSVVLLLSEDKPIESFEERLSPILPFMQEHGLIAGVSNRFADLSRLRPAAFQAVKAMQLGLGLDPGETLYCYGDYSLYFMAELCLRENDLSDFCLPEVYAIIEQSGRDDGELLNTLRAYLRNGRSKTQTAQELFIHVNTVKYRLQQIQNLYGLDLENDDNILKVLLSFKMLEYREKFPAYEPMDIMNNEL